jgi:2-polyprenyl-6-methoxyphenol hydroxylase-like FAD-dependent oxidoreductase
MASVVLVADGLSQEGLPAEVAASKVVAQGSRIGIGAVLGGDGAALPDDLAPGTIHMSVGRMGYVGVVRTETDRALVAAAVDPRLLNESGSPALAVAAILRSAGRAQWAQLASTVWGDAAWQGTPALTRRLRRPAAERLLVLGDAAGYVEPFTGEGIGWGIASAENVAPLALAASRAWNSAIERDWLRVERSLMEHRRRFCRIVARGLRSPWVMGAAMRVLGVAPGWSAPFVRFWNRPLPLFGSMSR